MFIGNDVTRYMDIVTHDPLWCKEVFVYVMGHNIQKYFLAPVV